MSASNSDHELTWDEKKEFITSLVVETVETEFRVEKQMDDAGTHLMVYLPETARETFSIPDYRQKIVDKLGFARVLLCFVSPGFIETALDT
jgi:hypothetical protein